MKYKLAIIGIVTVAGLTCSSSLATNADYPSSHGSSNTDS